MTQFLDLCDIEESRISLPSSLPTVHQLEVGPATFQSGICSYEIRMLVHIPSEMQKARVTVMAPRVENCKFS